MHSKTVNSTLEAIQKRSPAYSELTTRFGPLLLEKALLMDELTTANIKAPAMDVSRLSAGVPILADMDCTPWTDLMQTSIGRLLPIVAEILQLDTNDMNALQAYLDHPEHISGLAQALIEGNWKHFENTSVQLNIKPATLLYISETVFGPVFRAIVGSLGESLSELHWEHGSCPACGSTPTIAYLSPKETTELDQLVGGGGKKYLHCSLCGHDWRFKRNGCPACGNDENNTRDIFTVDNRSHERIEACGACGTYILGIDLRECAELPDLDTIHIGLIHLDIHAQDQGLMPMARTIWNSLGT
ncbi:MULTISPECIES: formate dehydrogenase accessory protein FdhE [unclassified Pseudodesulfovibrio]|uniref:formate dehydrogenase accessory protein FdhE n=1 Tax=unclassified Pseudodesulfovibrio TaxID=2661612 RepID=UPI000FEB99DD|nr:MULTISPECIES: formate dehydrogenase accessory protein FdhE [unclassified Pseudodesulfovibrio]MCJ2163997.1 formate dehydrogenase accessory protein FdhE [Pseudodesulfovibrio sp. S3-i]RWU05364.1 formate dehydrogenase accessory protein FdhE [Pseudodesulfovibrio sp. S3]